MNGATCVDETNQYSCTCDAGYEGTNCETGKKIGTITGVRDKGVVTCTQNALACKLKVKYLKLPSPGADIGILGKLGQYYLYSKVYGAYLGPTGPMQVGPMNSAIWVWLMNCTCDPCMNGATCVDQVNQYACTCDAGYECTNCETGISNIYIFAMTLDEH